MALGMSAGGGWLGHGYLAYSSCTAVCFDVVQDEDGMHDWWRGAGGSVP